MDTISFTVNGEQYILSATEITPSTSLNDYLRNHLNLRGTKVMCHEGGCGACIVSVSVTNPSTKETKTFSVNSCLVSILSCHRWDIMTIEGIGNRKDGYHEIQTRLASFNGTQCGYCTPGWVMNMYSLSESKNNHLSMEEVENSFASNMCRCTGYRPILDAFKSLANNASQSLANKSQDLEDLAQNFCSKAKVKGCVRRCSTLDDDWCVIRDEHMERIQLDLKGHRWYKVYKIKDIFQVLDNEGTDSYRFVNGNTGQGVYHIETYPKIAIDISSVAELKESHFDVNLVVGAGMTLTDVMRLFSNVAQTRDDFKYLAEFYKHLDLVAHVPVRNIGTIGGNLALKNGHNEFTSDVFILLATVGGTVTVVDHNMTYTNTTIERFLTMDLSGKLIVNVKLPPLNKEYNVKTFKIMPRAQNAHAQVNAGFLLQLNPNENNRVQKATIVFGGIDPKFIHATNTESFLINHDLFDDATLLKALQTLEKELVTNENPPEPSGKFRKILALGLFYKGILSLCPSENLDPRAKSGGQPFKRPLSKGTQTFDTDKSLWPLNKPIPKLEALMQCSGEAKYCNDIPTMPREVYATFVLSTVARGDIDYFDTTEALKIDGVIAFFSSKDIPGKNSFAPTSVPWVTFDEEILSSGKIQFYGQPVGIIVANTEKLANRAAHLVKVYYKNTKNRKPVLSIRDAIAAPKSEGRVQKEVDIAPTDKGENTTKVIKGSFAMPSQYHYTMECQSCVVVPCEEALEVYPATQWANMVQVAIAQSLNIMENKINVTVRRVGGAYGAKASRSTLIATACALVAYKLNRPARFVMSIETNMQAIGKRQHVLCDYEVGIDNEGVIQYLTGSYYQDCGVQFNDSSVADTAASLKNFYNISRWTVEGYNVKTDKTSNCWARGPGSCEAHSIMEHITERIAFEVNKDVSDVKILNIDEKNDALKEMITSYKTHCDYETRKQDIAKFNSENRWRKRAIKLGAMSYPVAYSGVFGVTISVFHGDGTVAVGHAGIEMGQGINTKVAQVCAHELNIPLEKVSIKPYNSFVTPNAMVSSSSVTSESVAFGTVKACEELLQRLQPVKETLTNPTWEELIQKAFEKGVNLQTSYLVSDNDNLQGYTVYGVTIVEVELDVLTGQHQVLRVDILEDAGQSLSPEVDVGQIEGSFIMGLGLWTSEELIYDPNTGKLLTDRTWTYYPPGVKDIPIDFRVDFRNNSPNPAGVLRSKATGEPALVMAVTVTHAIHDAAVLARKEMGYDDDDWLEIETPFTLENILLAISPKIEEFRLKKVQSTWLR